MATVRARTRLNLRFLKSDEYRQARRVLSRYDALRTTLREQGILRSERVPQADYAEWLAARLLRLTLISSGAQRGYDAVDSRGQRYQVKVRIVANANAATSFDFKERIHPFDVFVGVLMSRSLDLLAVVRISKANVLKHLRANAGNRRLRWTSKLYEAPWVEVLYRTASGRVKAERR